jgi:hypothetical protein
MLSEIRNGKFTSSEISALLSNGKSKGEVGAPFKNYVKQTNQERRLGRSLDTSNDARSLKWGKFVESWLMLESPEVIGFEYTLTPNSTIPHPKYPDCWCGSRDGLNNNTNAIIDLKCPFTLGSFCDFADCSTIDDVRKNTKDGEKYYWQLVSNASIHGTDNAELIIFVPNLTQVKNIIDYAINGDHSPEIDCYFIGMSQPEDLPFIPDNSHYPNVIRFKFDIPNSDFELLEDRVKLASSMLVNNYSTLIESHCNETNVTIIEEIK